MSVRFDITQRKTDENTTHKFYVDGYQRQANNTLRRILLDSFPTISIDMPLRHSVKSFSQALKEQYIILCTLRSPKDSINSFCGYKKIDPLNKLEIIHSLEMYCYLHEYLLENKNYIKFIHFDQIIYNPGKLTQFIKEHFSIQDCNFKEYHELKLTPFFTHFDEDGEDGHNMTSNLATEEKLGWITKNDEYKEANNLYDKLTEQLIKIGEIR